jgi:hypothetical protein
MSACPNALSAKPLPRPTDARAARLERFWREQRIVDYLNRGVSVAEIAARIGVGEKRTRAVIRDILARRMPHTPEEFAAIQMSRLNEALLVAFSAMSTINLKAVDQVVKIVRELDRYGGAFAAEWARPAASRLEAPEDGDVAFARAWLAGGELEDEGDERPEIPWQAPEKIESAPGNLLALRNGPRDWDGGGAPPLLREAGKSLPPGEDPGVSPKATDGVWRAATDSVGSAQPSQPTAGGAAPLAAPHPTLSGHLPQQSWQRGPSGDNRPEIPAQIIEKVESAPGIAAASKAGKDAGRSSADVAGEQQAGRGEMDADGSTIRPMSDMRATPHPALRATPGSSPGGRLFPSKAGEGVAAPRFEMCEPPRPDGQAQAAVSPSDARPENPAQAPDKIDSAPETAGPAAVPNDVSLILTPTGWKPMRMPMNGVAA